MLLLCSYQRLPAESMRRFPAGRRHYSFGRIAQNTWNLEIQYDLLLFCKQQLHICQAMWYCICWLFKGGHDHQEKRSARLPEICFLFREGLLASYNHLLWILHWARDQALNELSNYLVGSRTSNLFSRASKGRGEYVTLPRNQTYFSEQHATRF